jgi:DNA polymerase I-like protein with 3'-5' exonuclease and polymerase domains
MLVGFDTEYSFGTVRWIGGRPEPDVTTGRPVCACLAYEDGRELRFGGDWGPLGEIVNDPANTIVVHGAHSERYFCELVGIPFPDRHVDTLLLGVLLAHATTFEPTGRAYGQAGLAALAGRFGVVSTAPADKDPIRESILCGRYREEYGMAAVHEYCADDARTCLRLATPLTRAVAATCGANALRNLEQLYQPFSQVMAAAARAGLRFDGAGWARLEELAPAHRDRLLAVMRAAGYDHDGPGLGATGFGRMLRSLGLDRDWPRTPTGAVRTAADELKARRHLAPAVQAAYDLVRFDDLLGQRLGDRVDRDGRIRCGILPLAQRSSRTSTVRPNLMGIPGELRPLLLPDEGCVFVHFDFAQQEAGVAAWLSRDAGLIDDFGGGDVYVNAGRRMGLVRDGMTPAEIRAVRNSLLKMLWLSIMYGKSAFGLARDLRCSVAEAGAQLAAFRATYPQLFRWLEAYVARALHRGWAESLIGFRAAFDVTEPGRRNHVARSAQNFPIQAAAQACFQVTGVHLADMGADIRLPLHDAYLLNVPDDPRDIAAAREMIQAATTAATNQLFDGLPVKTDVLVLRRFAKGADEDSLERLISSLYQEATV